MDSKKVGARVPCTSDLECRSPGPENDKCHLYPLNVHKIGLLGMTSIIKLTFADKFSILLIYPLAICYIAIENGPVEIVDLPVI